MGGGPSTPVFNNPFAAFKPPGPFVFAPPPPAPVSSTDAVTLISVFHPFPIRIDTPGNGSLIQYDACLQVGEFKTAKSSSNSVVILVPLKADPNPGDGASFINAFANKIPSILGAQPDQLLGYPDVPAATGADWNIAQVVKTDRSYYTWTTKDGTRVIVMAEPILIAQGDLTNIQRLPVTPPEDVIHEIGNVRYKPAPPIDSNGNPVPCKSRISVPQMVPGPTAVAMTKMNTPAVSGTDWLAIILGILGSVAVLIGVWFGLKAAMGPGGTFLKTIGDALGKSLAGGYGALKKAVPKGVPNVVPSLPVRTPTQVAEAPAPNIPEPSSDFSVTNPGYSSKQAFIDRHKTQRRTPAQIANTPAPKGTPAAMGNIAPVNLPEPSGDFAMKNPGYSSKQAFIDRHKTQRAPRPGPKIRTPAEVAAAPGPDAAELFRRQRAESFRRKSPAGTGLFDLRTPAGPVDEIAQRKPKLPGRVAIAGPEESNTQRIARLARAKKASKPAPKKRVIAVEEPDEETPEERIERRAKETALPRPGTNLKTQYMAQTGSVVRGGKKKRKNRMKTGRKV